MGMMKRREIDLRRQRLEPDVQVITMSVVIFHLVLSSMNVWQHMILRTAWNHAITKREYRMITMCLAHKVAQERKQCKVTLFQAAPWEDRTTACHARLPLLVPSCTAVGDGAEH